MTAEVIRINGRVLFPRCRIPMEYMSVTEKDSRGARILRYYKCPACHTRVVDERIEVRREGGSVKLVIVSDGKTIISVARPARKRRSPPPPRR